MNIFPNKNVLRWEEASSILPHHVNHLFKSAQKSTQESFRNKLCFEKINGIIPCFVVDQKNRQNILYCLFKLYQTIIFC